MNAVTTHDAFRRHIRAYLMVFVALLVGTVLTVGAWKYAHLPTMTLTVALALFIAVIKAFLVAGYFMHLMSERKMIYAVIGATGFFVAGLLYLIVWSHWQRPAGTTLVGEPVAHMNAASGAAQ
jgi:cytochrome c oxidase subunit 4